MKNFTETKKKESYKIKGRAKCSPSPESISYQAIYPAIKIYHNMEKKSMIIYLNILDKLKAAGYTTYRLRKEKLLPESALTKIRNNQTITTETLNTVCDLTGLKIEQIIKHRPD